MVNKIFQKSSSLLFKRQTSILSAAVIMMLLVLASKILGLWRNWFLARYFGASGPVDAFNTAFVIPDLLANVLITGALSVAFIPIFTSYINKRETKEAEILASSILNISLLVYLIVGTIIFLFPSEINHLLGLRLHGKYDLVASELMRLVVLGELFLVIGSFFTSVLQCYHRFLIAAVAPVVYNLGIIIGIVVFSRFWGIYGVGLGVILGAILHMFIQFVALESLGFKYRNVLQINNQDVIRVLKLSLPRALGVGVGQLEILVNYILASALAVGSIAVLEFAVDLQNLPIGLFGVTIAAATLPTLSGEWVANKKEEFKITFLTSLFQLLYLAVPISVLLTVLRIPIVRLAVGSGVFTWPATVATATTLSFFAIGVFAQAGFLLVTRAFYAMHDTITPLKVAVFSLLFHAVVSVYLIFVFAKNDPIPVSYLGLSTSISGAFSFFVLLFILDRRLGKFDRKKIVFSSLKIFVPALMMAVFLYVPLHLKLPQGEFVIDYIIDTKKTLNLLFLTLAVSIAGMTVYVLLTWWLKSNELASFTKMIPNFKKIGRLLDINEPVEPSPSAKEN